MFNLSQKYHQPSFSSSALTTADTYEPAKLYKIYVDGSYNKENGVGAYAFVVVNDNNQLVHKQSSIVSNTELLEGWQVGCECKAVVEAIRWCVNNNAVCDIYYDLANLKNWVNDLWGNKAWKTNTKYSQAYRYYIMNNRQYLRNMVKVKSHTGDFYNEMVDSMCNQCYAEV